MIVSGALAISTVTLARRPPSTTPEATDAIDREASESRELALRAQTKIAAGALPASLPEMQTQIVSPHDVDSVFAAVRPFVRLPKTGIASVDDALNALAPQAEEATRDAVARAANLVRYGDRSTVCTKAKSSLKLPALTLKCT